MTDHPLYLSPALIPAFVAGRVSLLVEPLKVQPPEDATLVRAYGADAPRQGLRNKVSYFIPEFGDLWPCGDDAAIPLPHVLGDRLWLAEEWVQIQGENGPQEGRCLYRVDARDNSGRKWQSVSPGDPDGEVDWQAAATMPKWAFRAWAEVEAVEVKRVQDVTEAECEAAGIDCRLGFHDEPVFRNYDSGLDFSGYSAATSSFQSLWSATHGPDAWGRNPWCTFTRIKVHSGNLEGEV